jgi:hypothetical protein
MGSDGTRQEIAVELLKGFHEGLLMERVVTGFACYKIEAFPHTRCASEVNLSPNLLADWTGEGGEPDSGIRLRLRDRLSRYADLKTIGTIEASCAMQLFGIANRLGRVNKEPGFFADRAADIRQSSLNCLYVNHSTF